MKKGFFFLILCLLLQYLPYGYAQNIQNNPKSNHGNKFEQLGTILPDANSYRTASGAPGYRYWQMRADYDIEARIDESTLQLFGSEWITYYNNSPEPLQYLWLQLDENEHDPNSDSNTFNESQIKDPYTAPSIEGLDRRGKLQGYGCKIDEVKGAAGQNLPYTINQTMMRVDLPISLMPGKSIKFKVKWHYKIPNRMTIGGRGGLEYFPEDGNHLFTITQWYPRMCVYSDFQGWQNRQFTGRGEFALTFGNFNVKMTVPADHIIAATGECQNYKEVLSPERYQRWLQAQNSKEIVEIATLDEAKNAEQSKSSKTKTWIYKAENVRDFAWGSSRKFIWDAVPEMIEGKKVMCMSYYPKEAYSLYRKYSTKVVAHTIKTYSKYTIAYPYPVAISVEASNGMEYPMICFNFGRTEKDGTYSEGTKYGAIGVIIHEVGHNFFPMIINSDERQWSWMDEGLNTFVQFLTEQEFDNNYPSQRGPAHKIVDYMSLPKDQLEPIMTNSDNIIQFGPNAYAKPATGLNILRETIMGRELFDYAFKQYCQRWAFKHPTPADLFRTMEDASGVDLDWFWRGWFYDIDPVDISLDSVRAWTFSNSPDKEFALESPQISKEKNFESISKIRNREAKLNFAVDRDTSLRDFYYYNPDIENGKKTNSNMEVMPDSNFNKYKDTWVYELHLSNKGGMVMPVIIQWNYEDGTNETERISAHIWRKNEHNIVKTFAKPKKVATILLDPMRETADINEDNNAWNAPPHPTKFQLFQYKQQPQFGRRGTRNANNPMQQAKQKQQEGNNSSN